MSKLSPNKKISSTKKNFNHECHPPKHTINLTIIHRKLNHKAIILKNYHQLPLKILNMQKKIK